MQTESVDPAVHDQELNQILAAYLEAAEARSAPEPAEYLRRHPAFAAELAEFFALRQQVEGVAAPLRAALAGAGAAPESLRDLVLQLGDFRIVREIGRGGMGIVYEAQQQSLGRRVALKVLPFAGALDARQLLRFKTEAQAAGQLHHTHIVPVHFVGCEHGVHFYAMQYIDGPSLATVIDELRRQRRSGERGRVSAPSPETETCAHGTTPVPHAAAAAGGVSLSSCLRVSESAYFQAAARLVVQAAEALEHAHEMGVIHRDIKPANLLLEHSAARAPLGEKDEGDGLRVWVTDFGLARLQSDAGLTATGDVLGTLRYMSPEQALGQRAVIDHRTDVYSLGVTLYELLTLEPAFAGADRHAVLQKIAFEEPRPPCRVNAAIPRELETIVLKAIAKEPRDRYATAQALADDLRRFLEHRPILARRPTLAQRARKWLQRNPGLAWAAMAGLLLGSVVSVWKFVDERAARREADSQRTLAEQHLGTSRHQEAEAVRAKQNTERERDAANRNLYFADMRLGLVDWKAGNLVRLSSKLRRHVPNRSENDPRGWEWYYLLALCHEEEHALFDAAASVDSVAWSPDGRYLASTSNDGSARIYDTSSWHLLQTLASSNCGVSWSPDSQKLAWGTRNGNGSPVYVWHADTKEIQALRGHSSSVWATAWSPDGKQLASAGIDSTLRIWEPATGSCLRVLTGFRSNIRNVAWHPEGKLLAVGADAVTIWDTVSWQPFRPSLPVSEGSIAWSPDGRRFAVYGYGKAHIYRTDTWSVITEWDTHAANVHGVAWSGDGLQLATAASDGLIKVWDPSDGTCKQILHGHRNAVHGLGWEPNGNRLASAGKDGSVRIWRLPVESQPRLLQAGPGNVQSIAWADAPDTLRSLDATEGIITHWNVATGQRLEQTPIPRSEFGQFGARGRLVGLAPMYKVPAQLVVCDTHSGKPVQTLNASIRRGEPVVYGSRFCSFSHDGSRLALTSEDRQSVEIIDLSPDSFRLRWKVSYPTALSWSPDGRFLAIASTSGGVQVIDAVKRQAVLTQRSGPPVYAVAWSPGGQQLVFADGDGLATVSEVPTGRTVVHTRVHSSLIWTLAWSPDGSRIASGATDRTVCVWDATHGEELLRLDCPVSQLFWSSDGHRLAINTGGKNIRIFDAAKGYNFVHSAAYHTESRRDSFATAKQLVTGGRWEEAIALYEAMLQTSKAELGSDHPDTLECMLALAEAYLDNGKFDQAEPLLLHLLQHHHSKPHWQRDSMLAILGLTLLKQQKYIEAEPFLRECLTIRVEEAPKSWLHFNAQSMLGGSLLGQGKYAEAEPLLLHGYEGMHQREATIPAGGKHRLTEAAERLVRLYEAIAQAEKAADWREKAKAKRLEDPGP